MAAQGAELKLRVSLDLAALRNQLNTIGTQLSGQALPLAVKFDRQSVSKEFQLLNRYIGGKKFNIEIKTNLDFEIDKARKLAAALAAMPKAAAGTPGAMGSRTQGAVLRAEELKKLTRIAVKEGGFDKNTIRIFAQRAIDEGIGGIDVNAPVDKLKQQLRQGFELAADDANRGLINGLLDGRTTVGKAAAGLGEESLQKLRATLKTHSPSKETEKIGKDFGKGFEIGAMGAMDKAFDALEHQIRSRLAELQRMMTGARGEFPFVAKTGPIEQKALMARSMALASEVDKANAQLASISQRREGRMALQRESLQQVAGRMLPPARDRSLAPARTTIIPGGTASEQITRDYFRALKNAQDFFERNFAANTYLPQASKTLASSMQVASKQLTGTRLAGLLPSKEMMDPLRFSRAISKAIEIDFQNAISQQMRGMLLPGAGQSSASAMAFRSLSGQKFQAPRLGQATASQPGAAMGQTGPIADRLRQAAVNFSKNAPAVIKYLNLFSTAGGINISDLPGANESPGQYIRRIQESLRIQLKEGGFGPGQTPSRRDFFQPGQGPQLPGMPLQPLLPPAGGIGGGDRVRGVGQPPERGGALALAGGPSTRLPKDYFENVKRYNAALDIARSSMKNFQGQSAPFIGGLRDIASEFGMATKQVLLYGTAYKALAFITSLPGQIIDAAKGQQQYNNALQTATQDTGTFAKELLYVDNVQRAFGLNLETTRTGFTRLFASMAPSGFDSGSIEKLFTGISAATAALQLTPDKAERVIYAFGQMASKGQIMSEELKGQLGDVLPGALAIFAKAAGMSVKEFSKAMEDGAFIGGKFREVFAKVSDELMTRFGTGAQAAGKSLQGLLNTVQGDFQRTLQSFSPLADAAAQSILGPLGGALRQLSTSAQIAMGEMERIQGQLSAARQNVRDVRTGGGSASQIQGAEQQVAALEVRYSALNEALKDPAVVKQVKDLQALVRELTKAGIFALNLASTIGSVLSPVVNFLGTNLTSVVATITTFYIGFQTARLAAMALMGALMLYRGLSTILGFAPAATQALALSGAFNVLGVSASRAEVQLVGVRLALTALVAATVVGVVVAGIVAIAGAFATMSDKAKEAAQSSRDAAKAAIDAGNAGDISGASMNVQNILTESRNATEARKALEAIYKRSTPGQRKGIEPMTISPAESAALKGSKLTEGLIEAGVSRGGKREIRVPSKAEMSTIIRQFGSVAGEQSILLGEAKAGLQQAEATSKRLGLNKPTPGILPPETEDEKALRAQAKLAEEARKLADDKAKYEADLLKMNSLQALELDDIRFEHWKSLQQEKYNILMAGENSWLSQAIKFQKDLQDIEIGRIEAVRKARDASAKAEIEAGAKSYIAGGAAGPMGAPGPGGKTGLLQGSTGISSKPHFHVMKADGSPISEAEARALFSADVQKRLTKTSGYGPRNTGIPGASRFHKGVDLAGPANTPLNLAQGYSLKGVAWEGDLGYAATIAGPQGQMYKAAHLQPPRGNLPASQVRAGQTVQPPGGKLPASRVRAEERKDYNAALAAQNALNAKERESVVNSYEKYLVQQKISALIKEQVALIAPVKQQKLENQLLQQKISLISSGAFGDALDMEMQIAEARGKAAVNIELAEEAIKNNNKLAKEQKWTNEQLTAENKKQYDFIAKMKQDVADYIPLLKEKLRLEQASAEATLQGQVKRATPFGGMGLSLGFIGESGEQAMSAFDRAIGRGASDEQARAEAKRFGDLQNQLTLLETRNNAVKSSIMGIGDAFGTAMTTGIASLVDGTATAQEVFSSFLKTIGQTLLQAAQQMIATYIAIGIAKMFAGLGGGFSFKGAGPVSGSSVFGSGQAGFNPIAFSAPRLAANGAVWQGGFTPFANGGVVNGPTLGLIGEGRYNEAIVPLPDGRSIPVMMRGDSIRDKMESGLGGGMASPVLNMSFETTSIGGVEYVSRDQLEAAMAQTRRDATRDGAKRGMTMTIDRLQQSPQTRSRVGLR